MEITEAQYDRIAPCLPVQRGKEPCAPAAAEAMFFLHLIPADMDDLPDGRKRHGFDGRGAIFDGRCMAAVALPEYDIARIGTGQYVPVDGGFEHLWEGEIGLGGSGGNGRRWSGCVGRVNTP